MEIKYLSEQETGDLILPICHVEGVVGLDINPTTDVTSQSIILSSEYLDAESTGNITYYDNLVSIWVNLKFSLSGIEYLKNGNTIEIESTSLNNTEDVALDCIIRYDSKIAQSCMGYVWVKDSKLYIRATSKVILFSQDPNDVMNIIEEETEIPFTHINGNALTTTKSFAPIKPVRPKGYIIFTLPERVNNISIGPVEHTETLDIISDNGTVTFTRDNKMYYITVEGATGPYNLTIRGKFTSFVYPKSAPISKVEIHDCPNLNWFSVNEKGADIKMSQNNSIVSFGLYGYHRMTNLSYFLSNLPNLTTVTNLNTTGVLNLKGCFYNSYNLTALPDMDLSSITTIRDMCYGCIALSHIPDTIDWSKVVDATNAFYQCSSLTILPLFNTTSLVYANYMFFGCNKIGEINMESNKIQGVENMFVECTTLVKILMSGLSYGINIQDTNLKTKQSVIDFIESVGIASNPATVLLPQAIPLYEFDNNFIAEVTSKNWKLG